MDGGASGSGGRESNGDGSRGRLPTFRSPRDLSLTGKSPIRPRKTYVPNIPPKRDRSASSTSTTASPSRSDQVPSSSAPAPEVRGSPSPGQRGRGGRGRDLPERGRKKAPDLVQSSSIFSDGVGDGEKGRKADGSRGFRSGGGGEGGGKRGGGSGGRFGASESEKHFRDRVIDEAGKLLEGNLSFQETQAKVHEMIGDGRFIAELEDEEDENIDTSLHAIELPMSSYLASTLNELKKKPIAIPLKPETFNPEVKTEVKLEKPEEPAPPTTDTDNLDPLSFAHTVINAPPDGTLVFFQMPDRLPVLDQSSSATGEPKEAKLANSIAALPEGYIGKMQIFASGATRLLLGENAFDVLPATPISFRQELVAIDLEEKKMTALGPVQKKFLVIPDLEQLFRESL